MDKIKQMLVLETAASQQYAQLSHDERVAYAAAHPQSTFRTATSDTPMTYDIKRAQGGGHTLHANGEHLKTFKGRDSENRAADAAMRHAATVHKGPYKIKRPAF